MPLPLPAREGTNVDLVAVGECSLDVIGVSDGWPSPDEKRPLSGLAVCPGGQAATAALCCQRLGWRSRYVGPVGHDDAATRALAGLRAGGVDVHAVVRDQASTRQAIVFVDRSRATRTVLERRDEALVLRAEDVRPEWVSTGRILLVDATSAAAARFAASVARGNRRPVIVDLEGTEAGAGELLAHVDIVVVAGSAIARLTGTADPGEGLRRLSVEVPAAMVIVTLGGEGSLARAGGTEVATRALPVEVVDTTGAGDAFRAGLAAGWLARGATAEIEWVLAYANAVAGLSCRAVGAQSGLPTAGEVGRLM